MDLDSLNKVGRIGKTWGHQGELSLHLEGLVAEDLEDHGSLFVDIQGQKVPFFFSSLRDRGRQGTLVKFDEIDDPQAAAFLVGCDVYVPPGLLIDGSDESWDPEELIGLLVVDREHGELGEVTGMDGTERNPVLVVQKGEQEVLIPLVEDMVEEMDPEAGVLYVRTPPGLLDMNA